MEEKSKLPELYKGQIWVDDTGTYFRKIISISHKAKPLRLKFVSKDGEASSWESIDEFVWWIMQVKARPILTML